MGKFTQEAKDFLDRIINIRREKTPIKEEKYTFRSRAVPDETFHVLNFEGQEGLSSLYRFTINLVSEKAELDVEKILSMPVLFVFQHPEGKHVLFHGIVSEFQQLHQTHGLVFYRAVMVPKLWWLTQTSHNQVFINQTAPEIIEAVLKDGGLTSLDYELRLKEDYNRTYEYACQYQETHYDFLCRWLEREGMYYYFELTSTGEKVIITDTNIGHTFLPQGDTVKYSPVSGLEHAHRDEVASSFNLIQKRLPESVLLKNYNYNRPSLDLSVQTRVDSAGLGRVYVYGDDYRTIEEGQRLARLRTEMFNCRQKTFQGESSATFLRPGFLFKLIDHYRGDFNNTYLTVSLQHEGDQAAQILAGLSATKISSEKKPSNKNTFTVIPADIQYRPERITEKPRIYGAIHAHIDAAGSGQYAELDDQGRYKVILPFDLSGKGWGKASAWLRQVQPYSGSDHGFHFPLHKGTEVLLTFIDGDPDNPVIAGAVPNPLTPSPVRNVNQTKNIVHTAGGNRFELEDLAGKQRILLSTPHADTYLSLGAPPPAPAPAPGDENQGGDGEPVDHGLNISTQQAGNIHVGQYMKTETGAVTTPDSTVIPDQTDRNILTQEKPPTPPPTIDAGPPQTGDFYLTTGRNSVQNAGGDHFLSVTGKKLEKVVGDSSQTVGGDFGQMIAGKSTINVAQAVTQNYGSTLNITAADTIKQICAKDVTEDILGNKAVTITGKDTRTVGHKIDTVMGATDANRLGAFNVFTLGLNSSMNAGGLSTLNLGAVSTASLAAIILDLKMAPILQLSLAAQFIFELSFVYRRGYSRVSQCHFRMNTTKVTQVDQNSGVVLNSAVMHAYT